MRPNTIIKYILPCCDYVITDVGLVNFQFPEDGDEFFTEILD